MRERERERERDTHTHRKGGRERRVFAAPRSHINVVGYVRANDRGRQAGGQAGRRRWCSGGSVECKA